MEGSERRQQTPRVSMNLELKITEEGSVEPDRGHLTDLSATGAFVRMGMPLDPGRGVRVAIDDGGRRVAISALVVRRRPDGVAIRFSTLNDSAAAWVERQVETRPSVAGIAPPCEEHVFTPGSVARVDLPSQPSPARPAVPASPPVVPPPMGPGGRLARWLACSLQRVVGSR